MKLQTQVEIKPSKWKIEPEDKILAVGSCFADEISRKMEECYLPVTSNPFGTLYNPLSIAQAFSLQPSDVSYQFYDGLWHSMAHHGSFSRPTKEEAEKAVVASIETLQRALKEAKVVIVTFGSAWIYESTKGQGTKDKGQVVANCHKMPAEWFSRRRLTVEEIVAAWKPIIEAYADKRWIFTVSPIRHVKDGLHENQLSKATLLMAVEQLSSLVGRSGGVTYFPSYEIVLDELRDYRFYADDLVHPSSLAVNYIWERFCETYFSPQTRNELVLAHKRWQFEHHRPLH